MVVPGKFDACRARKVKCDEVKPKCSSCVKVDRECCYAYGKFSHFVIEHRIETGFPCASDDSKNLDSTTKQPCRRGKSLVVLNVRSSQGTASGDGVFHTFAAVPVPGKKKMAKSEKKVKKGASFASSTGRKVSQGPCPQLCSRETRLASHFMALTESKPCQNTLLTVMGDCLALIPKVSVQSELVYFAAISLVNGLDAYNDRSANNLTLYRKSNTSAIQALRSRLSNLDRQPPTTDLCLVIRIISLVEVMHDPGAPNFLLHFVGLNNLLSQLSMGGTQFDEISRSVYYSSFPCSVSLVRLVAMQVKLLQLFHDILLEKDSIFDNEAWLNCSSPTGMQDEPAGCEFAWQTIMRTGVRLARLVRLVRRARPFPEDLNVSMDAMILATDLWDLQLDIWIQSLEDNGVLKRTPTTHHNLKGLVADSFKFSSTHLLSLLIQYWELRIIVSGCLQTLLTLSPASLCPPPCEFDEVQQSDMASANYLMMSFEHLFRLSKSCSAVELRFVFPIQMAFGPWYRLEQLERLKDGNDSSRVKVMAAREMQIRCLELQNHWKKDWHPQELVHRNYVALAEMFSGGHIWEVWRKDSSS